MAKKNGSAAAAAAPAPESQLQFLRAGQLEPWPGLNPRRRFDEAKLAELTESVRTRGVHQPILVHPRPNGDAVVRAGGCAYWIVAGERRWRAASAVGGETIIPCMVREYSTEEALEIALIENIDRDDLSPIEEARGFQALIDAGWKQSRLVERFGRSQAFVSNRIRLLQLPDEILTLVEAGSIDVSQARDILLPFNRIPEGKREQLWKEATPELVRAAKKGPLDERTVVDSVGPIAHALSHSLAGYGYNDEPAAFDPALHTECPCKVGPLQFSAWGAKTERCFDDEWWTSQQAAATKAAQKTSAKKQAKLTEAAERMGDRPVYDAGEFRQAHGYNIGGRICGRDGKLQSWKPIDPTELDPSTLIVLRDGDDSFSLLCTDDKAFERARAAFAKRVKEIASARRAGRDAEDIAAAKQVKLQGSSLRALLREPEIDLTDALHSMGVESEEGWYAGDLSELSDAQVLLLAKLYALRAERGDYAGYGSDPLESAVSRELLTAAEAALRTLIPWEIKPEWLRDDDAGVEEDEEEFADEELEPAGVA